MEGNRHLGSLILIGLILICTLQDSVAIDAPAIVALENEGSTDSLKVTWTSPADATAHEVTWSPPDSFGNITSGDLSGTADEYMYIINDLIPGTLYNVTVTTKDVADETNDTFGQGRTKPSPVLNLTESGATNESISAQWNRPISGVVEQYIVSCPDSTEAPSSPIAENGSAVYEASCVGLSTAGADYTITVTSQSGDESSDESTIIITALPNLVVLTASDSTVDSVSATWMKPAGEVTSYEVQCSGGNEVPPVVQTGDDPSSASCTGLLTAGDEYTMNVTSLSNGQRSDVTTIALRALPQAVVLSEASDEVTTSSIAATWTAPNGIVEYYNVSCSNGAASPAQVNPSEALTASCTGLTTPGDDYNISVTTVSNGQRSETDTITITALPEAVTLNEVDNMVTTTTITASWTMPDGIVEYFKVSCSDGTASPAQVNPSDDLTSSCIGLSNPGANYTISVTSVSNGKLSAASTITITALPEAVTLNEVSDMVTTTSIDASWNMSSGIVEYYEVSCPEGTASPERVNPSDDLIASCTGLSTPGDNYTITVTSVSYGKRSAASTITITALPEAVTLNEESAMVNTTTITASWTMPMGTVESYEVSCPEGTASPDKVDSSGDLTASCTGLSTPGDNYTITVTSVSYGKRSAASTITITALPESVTLDEESEMVTTDTITASWTMPSGTVESYEVSCSDNGVASPARVYPSGDLRASCTGLTTPGDNYTISVISVSYGKLSVASTITITALPEAVELSPGESNITAISATWTIPDDSVVDTYNIMCSNGTATPASIPVESSQIGDTFTAYCIGLPIPGLEYDLSVVAISNNKRSAIRTVGVHASPAGVDLTEGSPTTTSVSVNWAQPQSAVERYSISCSSGVASPATIEDTNQLSYMASCVNLTTPGNTYTMTVYSIVNSGATNTSSSIPLVALPLSADLAADTSTINSVSATWPYPGGVVEVFEVDCSNGTESSARLLVNQTSPDPSYLVSCDGVWNPGDNYSMVVTSLSNGKENSASIILTALPEAVTLNEARDMVTTTTIAASWTIPNGIVENYEVSCSDGTARVNPTDDLTAFCDSLLIPGDDYNISVTSVSNGQRSETDTITITALPEAVELSPGQSNITAISATWTIPNSVVDTFNITCSDGAASPASISVDSSQGGQQLTAYCVGLPRSGEQYDLSVVAISKEKLSAVSTVGVFALPLGVDLEEGPSTLTSVSASWMRQNDTVESYSIKCSHGDAFPSTIEDTDPESFSAACVNLTGPGATYRMTVYSEVGTNSSSNSTRASSLIQLVAVPASVESIAVTEPTTTTVDVQWNLMQCSECVYNYFLLTYEPDSQEPIRVDYTDGVNEYSSQVSGLTEGRSYSFTVVSVSGVGVQDAMLKTSEEMSVDQRTVPATPSELSIVPGQRELNLVWLYQGDADNFTITITPDHGIAVFNGNVTDPAAEVTGLTPGITYLVAIVTVSGDERSEPITQSARTLPDKPSPVRNPQAEAENKNTITLTYESPAEPNGEITSYMISYIGTRNGNTDHEFSKDYDVVLTVRYEDLRAGFSYIFTIIAVNDGPFESDPVSSDPMETPQEEPSPVPEDYPYEANTVFSATSTTSFTVVLPDSLFSHDNGELLTFAVIITKEDNDPTVSSTELTYAARAENAYITAIEIPYPYSPSFGSNRRRRATESSATVVIGDGTCAAGQTEYCNGGLDDNTQYYYAFRAYNGMGHVTSSTFGPVKTVKDNTAAIAAGVSVSLIIIIVAVVVVVVFLKRRQPKEPSPRPSLEGRENQAYDGPDHEMRPTRRKTGGSMHRKSHSKPIVLNKFEGHYGRMKADSDFRFTEEYDEIRQVGKDQAIVAATEMVNRAKNRFTNILPYEHSRVKLAALADDPDTDYINANYIPGYNSPREFMACQGPLPGTVDDMWRMIWEKKTSIIVMLTQLVEKGKIKCHEYWPADYNPVTYGSIQVSIQALQQYDHWVIREFSISQGDEIRKLTQYHFMSWPDHGVPEKTWTMLDFVRTVREAIQKSASDRPIVAHCSAGVGRTGTYIALDRLMQAMQENDYIDIFGIICEMRMQRNHMVQTEKQYIFIHECVMDLMRRGEEEDTGESIYVNLPSNGFKDPDDVNKNLLDQAV